MGEILTKTDENDNEVGTIERSIAHSIPYVWHRHVMIIISNSKNELLFQLRNPDSISANTWAFVGGHVQAGLSTLENAKKEVFEESGIQGIKLTFLH